MDPLSDVLRALRLSGGIFLEANFTAPWAVLAEMTPQDCAGLMEPPRRMIAYHVVVEGRLLLSAGDQPPLEVRAGEIVMLPRNDVHRLASGPEVRAVDSRSILPRAQDGLLRMAHGGGGEPTRIYCGFLGTREETIPLLQALPTVLTVDLREGTSHAWVEASVRFAAEELARGRLAAAGMVSRLSECLLAAAVRQHLASAPDLAPGWLKGLADPQVGRALALMHQDLAARWTAESLARAVAMSRSAFTDRFTVLVGQPPIRYLAQQRLHSARLQLRESTLSVAQVAYAVGYESEEAFSRAFKRAFGVPPARWRDHADAA